MNLLNRLLGESIPTINVPELQDNLKDGKQPFLLDVREPDEFLSVHIAGTKLIPLAELSSRIKEVPQGREIVCICASGNRSASAARKLIAAGFKALSLENGMIAWQMGKLPIQIGMKS